MAKQEVRYVTFGQDHTHRVNNHTFDCDCVAKVIGTRETVWELFGAKFCVEYTQEQFDKQPDMMKWYPRGIIEAN